MSKVLSTKLPVDEIDRFNSAAEQQGLSKSGLLKHLVKEYLGSNKGSKTSTKNEPGNSSSLERRQTPWVCSGKRLPPDKQKVLRTGELEKYFSQMHQLDRIQNSTQRIFTDKTPMCSSSTAINSQGEASLAKVPDSKEVITKAPSVEQGFLKVKTQAKPKAGFGEFLFFGLAALGIVLARKHNSNQKILPEPNYSGYLDYNEDIAAAYRDMGIPYNL